MKDDKKIESDPTARDLDFLSQDLSDVLISIYSFLRKLTLVSDLPVFIRDRLREEEGEEYLREIDKKRKKNREEYYRSLFRIDKNIKLFDIDPEKLEKQSKKGR